MGEHFCLKWNNYRSSLTATFKSLRDCEEFVDMTLSAEGTNLKAHKVVLSACSPYFRELLSGIAVWQHPVLFLKDIPLHDLALILEFVYLGEVNVSQAKLQSFLKTASLLRIRGLADDTNTSDPHTTKRKRKPSHPESAKNQIEETAHRKRKSALAGGFDGMEPPAAKLPCGGGFGGVNNGSAAELLSAIGSSGGVNEEIMLKQEPADPVNCEFPSSGISDLPFVENMPITSSDLSLEGSSTGGDKEGGGKDSMEGTVTCLVCRAVLSNTNALYYHMNYVHSTGVQTMDLIRKMTQGEVKVKDEGE